MTLLIGCILVIGLTIATGYFVLQEFAYVAVDPSQLRRIADQGDPRKQAAAERALGVTRRLSFVLSGAQLGITVTALLVGFVAQPYLGEGLASLLGTASVPESIALPASLALALVLATAVQMILGELAPKNLAIARPERLAIALGRSTVWYLTIAGPIIRLFDTAANRLVQAVGIQPADELSHGATSDELSHIISAARGSGQLSVGLHDLLDRGLDFHRHTAAQAMVPRVDVITISEDQPVSDVVEALRLGRSRFPVISGSVDDVVGVVGIAEVLQVPPARRGHTLVRDIASPPLLIPDGVRLPHVLDTLRRAHRQLACVVDEFGGFAGVITLEDIAEELVGEITDSGDPAEAAIVRRSDDSWVIPASLRMDHIVDATGLKLPTDQAYETLGGLVMAHLGRIPQPGDEVTVDDIQLRVVSVHRHTARTVLARHLTGHQAPENITGEAAAQTGRPA